MEKKERCKAIKYSGLQCVRDSLKNGLCSQHFMLSLTPNKTVTKEKRLCKLCGIVIPTWANALYCDTCRRINAERKRLERKKVKK